MNLDPFGDPFRLGASLSTSNLFTRSRSGAISRPKKPEPPPEEEPEPLASNDEDEQEEAQKEEEKPGEKVVLQNPVWEVEEVGFNEETDISVEAELPKSQAHKTKVDFELFAKTPNGPESISKCQGNIEGGKAKGKIPVYIPQYKDEDGNLLAKVEYYFTAKHSGSDLLKDDTKVKEIDHMADRLIQSHILQDVTFATDKSFISPKNADALKSMMGRIKEWKKKHPDGKMAIFGHTDAVGKEDYNKKLSERRANSIFAFLTLDPDIWKALYDEEKWGLASTQELLKFLGHDPGAIDGQNGAKTQAAVKAFQTKKGMTASGEADAATREALYDAFFGVCNPEMLVPKDFDVIDGKPFAGCSEFNLAEKSQGACEKNRRVAVYLLKSNKNFPIQYPCKHGDIAPCKKQAGRKGERRTAGFGCLFYDQLVLEVPNPADEKPKAPISNLKWDKEAGACGDELKLQADSSLADGTELTAKLKTAKAPVAELKAKVAGGKLEFPWKVKDIGYEKGEDDKFLKEIEILAEIDHEGINHSPEKPLKLKKLVEAAAETFDKNYTWGQYSVHSHFTQAVEGQTQKVLVKKKVMKTWGGTYVNLTKAGITGKASGLPWDGYRWAKCKKGEMFPDQYWDGTAWKKVPATANIQGGDFGTFPLVKKGGKVVTAHSDATVWPEDVEDYNYDDYAPKRKVWIDDSNKRWSGAWKVKRKGCLSDKKKPCCDYDVKLTFEMDKVETYGDDVLCLAPGSLRSNAGLMFYGDSRIPMAAHEVGHLVGLPDEYDSGAVDTAVNGDGAVNGLDSTTLMGGDLEEVNCKIKKRHYSNFAAMAKTLWKKNGGKDEDWVAEAKEGGT